MELIRCPEPTCDAPAEVYDRLVLPSTDGGLEHVKVRCVHRHWYFLPVSSLAPAPAPPHGSPIRAASRG
jgi:hypothetical protein